VYEHLGAVGAIDAELTEESMQNITIIIRAFDFKVLKSVEIEK